MADNKIAIFPAAGALGGSISNHLLNFVPSNHLILVSRHPQKWGAAAKDAITRAADYDDANSLKTAFEGAKYLCLISYPSFRHPHRVKVHKQAIDTARQQGITHIFYCSLAFGGNCEPYSAAHVMQAHLETEAYLDSLAKSDDSFTYTVIREGIYSESYPIYTAFFDINAPSGEIKIPHDGSGPGVAWAKRDELGEASARLIEKYVSASSPIEAWRNRVLLLSGPKVLTLAETVEAITRQMAKQNIKIRQVSVDEYARQPQVATVLNYEPGETAVEWATAWEGIRKGETAVVSPLLGELLEREPEPFEITIRGLVNGSKEAKRSRDLVYEGALPDLASASSNKG